MALFSLSSKAVVILSIFIAACRSTGSDDSNLKDTDGIVDQADKQAGGETGSPRDTESARTYRYLHYNIKEFTTAKILDGQNKQTVRAASIVKNLAPDLISINEMQYDKKDVPTKGLPGTGQNMKRFLAIIDPATTADWQYTFGEGNTGKKAIKQTDGNYAENPNAPASRALADQVNFGTFPGQYSTGFATKFPIKNRLINNKIRWQDWDKSFPFANHALPDGTTLPPTMSLFDKNFNDSEVDIGGKLIHFITYHTVPAFDFGSASNTNVLRNQAQLEFLEWYLLGSCEPANTNSQVKQCKRGIRPLTTADSFIAVGDLNVDYNSTSPGAAVIKRLLTNTRTQDFRAENPDPQFQKDPVTGKSHITYMSDGVDLGKLQSNLDYFIVSKDLQVVDAKVAVPETGYQEISCHTSFPTAKSALDALTVPQDRSASVSTRYLDNNQRSYCVVSVLTTFEEFRTGSDHLPVLLRFKTTQN